MFYHIKNSRYHSLYFATVPFSIFKPIKILQNGHPLLSTGRKIMNSFVIGYHEFLIEEV